MSLQFQTVDGCDVAVLRGLPAPFAFAKVTPVTLSPAWQQRLGRYRHDSGGNVRFCEIQLTYRNGYFEASITLQPKARGQASTTTTLELRPISDSEAVVAGMGNGEGGVMRVLERGRGYGIVLFRFSLSPGGECRKKMKRVNGIIAGVS